MAELLLDSCGGIMERHTLSGDRLPLSCSDFRVKPTIALSFPEGLDGLSRHFPWLNQITKTPDRRSVASMNKKLCYRTGRAMRCVSHSLGNCRTSCTTNQNTQQIGVLDSEHYYYDRPTSNKLCASSHDAWTVVGVVDKLDRRRVL